MPGKESKFTSLLAFWDGLLHVSLIFERSGSPSEAQEQLTICHQHNAKQYLLTSLVHVKYFFGHCALFNEFFIRPCCRACGRPTQCLRTTHLGAFPERDPGSERRMVGSSWDFI